MELLLTILSVLALWSLLTVLVLGLLFILKPLEGTRGHMEKIAMGVRAIEKETEPLGGYAGTLTEQLGQLSQNGGEAARGLAQVNTGLGAVAKFLKPS